MDSSAVQDSKLPLCGIRLCHVCAKPENAVFGVIEEPVSFGRHALG
jgi:hypothetical protein